MIIDRLAFRAHLQRWRRGRRHWRRSQIVGAALLVVITIAASGLGAPAVQAKAHRQLRYSTARNQVVQRQPAAGSCHALGRGLYSRPDPRCTPGALNPAVTQSDIGRTICRAGWTATVRPSERVTETEKRASMLAYGDTRPIWDYEYDHFVPLELGGATNAATNLWPELGASPNRKDSVEDELNREVCDHELSLAAAQAEIVTDWVRLARRRHARPSTPAPAHAPATPPAASCSVSASWNGHYHDYDVYVRSDQPDKWASVTGVGRTDGYYTNNSGYADVYFHASARAGGSRITVQVGNARCSTTL